MEHMGIVKPFQQIKMTRFAPGFMLDCDCLDSETTRYFYGGFTCPNLLLPRKTEPYNHETILSI